MNKLYETIDRLDNIVLKKAPYDNYLAWSIANVLEHIDDDLVIKIQNRTNNKETKWLNIRMEDLVQLYYDVSDIKANDFDIQDK